MRSLTPQQYRWLMDRICHVCGTEMVEIGTEVHRSLQMKPVQFWVREDVYYTYACKACEQETGEAVVVSTPREPSVLHRKLCQETVLHGDETTLQVLREAGKSATSKSYMWLYRTSGCAEHPIVLYEYQEDRKAKHAEEFLDRFSGWLHADGYRGYHKLPERIRVVGCAAHARRKFNEALSALPKE